MPTVVPSTPFHLSTRHSSRRREVDKTSEEETSQIEGEKNSEATLQASNAADEMNEHVESAKTQNESGVKKPAKRVRPSANGTESKEGDGKEEEMSAPLPRSNRILDKYMVADAKLMCVEILDQVSKNSDPAILSQATCPAAINWVDVSTRMMEKHQLDLKPRQCQELWKYLAYNDMPQDSDDELLPDSDVEDFNATAEALELKRAAPKEVKQFRSNSPLKEPEQAQSNNSVNEAKNEDQSEPTVITEDTPPAKPSLPQRLELFPNFDASGFLKSNASKDLSHYAPLHNVAEQFVKRRRVDNAQLLMKTQTLPLVKPQPLNLQPATPGSAGPPPTPRPSTTPFDFFKRMFLNRTGMDDTKIRELFESAAPDVRSKCHQLGAQDLERFQRESLRQRLYEKSLRTPTPPAQASPAPQPDIV
ncbi:hypothetical protein LEN26_012215 [Aphanomyces euteiches]|nr:hypothetical protein LEN26_012215 [Aphanomyces euteiches]